MKFGVALSRLHPRFYLEATLEAERLGFESVWMAGHLVFPVEASGSPHPGDESPPVPPSTAVFDACGWLCLVVSPWRRSREFAEGLRRFAARFFPNAG